MYVWHVWLLLLLGIVEPCVNIQYEELCEDKPKVFKTRFWQKSIKLISYECRQHEFGRPTSVLTLQTW
jgi:hypothetical protein